MLKMTFFFLKFNLYFFCKMQLYCLLVYIDVNIHLIKKNNFLLDIGILYIFTE